MRARNREAEQRDDLVDAMLLIGQRIDGQGDAGCPVETPEMIAALRLGHEALLAVAQSLDVRKEEGDEREACVTGVSEPSLEAMA